MTIIQVPVAKAGKRPVSIDTDKIPETIYTYIFEMGLKAVIANRGMTKIKEEDYPTDKEFHAAALAQAEKNVVEMYAGKTRMVGTVKAKVSKTDPVMTEALRLAKLYAKSELKAAGLAVSKVKAADITKAAEAYINADPDQWRGAAEASLAAATAPKAAINIADLVKEDPELVAKGEKKKAEAKAKTAAKQKGKAPVAAKPKAKPAQHAKA